MKNSMKYTGKKKNPKGFPFYGKVAFYEFSDGSGEKQMLTIRDIEKMGLSVPEKLQEGNSCEKTEVV
jgi:hypothetical protein